MDEIWKSIIGFENYEISNFGQVRRDRKILKLNTDIHGYWRIQLCKDGKQSNHRLHRLLANAFIPNPDTKECVDHIDRNRKNNQLSNLRWVTKQENNLNTKDRIRNNTGERHITLQTSGKYQVRFRRNTTIIYGGQFETLEEAKNKRDEIQETID